MGICVVRLDSHIRYHRLSVIPQINLHCAIVNLDQNRLRCQSGYCNSRKGHTRKISRLGSDDDCIHLKILHEQRHLWDSLIPKESVSSQSDGSSDVDDDVDEGSEVEDNGEPTDSSREEDSHLPSTTETEKNLVIILVKIVYHKIF